MIVPPFGVKLRILEKGKRKLKIWLPFFLVWLFFLVLMLIFSPLVLLAAIILWPTRLGKKILMFGPVFFTVLSSFHGLNIQIEDLNKQVSLSFK